MIELEKALLLDAEKLEHLTGQKQLFDSPEDYLFNPDVHYFDEFDQLKIKPLK